jgi:zinc protease
MDFDTAAGLVGKYVGCLPKRKSGFTDLDSLRKIARDKGPYKSSVTFESITPKAIAKAGFISCNERDVMDRRILALASRIISDRMIKQLREEQQLVYSIGCTNQPPSDIPDTGMMFGISVTDPATSEKLADEILSMLRNFADKGPTEEEVTTAKTQTAKYLENQLKEPTYWLQQLSDMTYRKRPLAELKELPQVYETITAKQMQDAVKKYMTDERLVRIVATPEDKGKVVKEIVEEKDKTPSKQPDPAGAKG